MRTGVNRQGHGPLAGQKLALGLSYPAGESWEIAGETRASRIYNVMGILRASPKGSRVSEAIATKNTHIGTVDNATDVVNAKA
jgi:hypothetical protein